MQAEAVMRDQSGYITHTAKKDAVGWLGILSGAFGFRVCVLRVFRGLGFTRVCQF